MSGPRLKIAFIHQPWSVVDPRRAPADSVVLVTQQLAKRVARSCDVICYSRLGADLPTIEHVDGVEHRRINGPIDRYIKFAFGKLDKWGLRDAKRPFFASKFAYRQFINLVARDLQSLKPDVVHIQNFSQFVPIVRAALPDATLALQMHCEWLTQLDRETVARRIHDADVVLGVSEFLADRIRARYPEYARRICHVHNGADVELFKSQSMRQRDKSIKALLYVGRISPEKGIHTLLDAFAFVADKRDDVRLQIVGPERVVPYEMIVPFCDDPKVLEMAQWYRPGAYAAQLRSKLAALPSDRAQWMNQEIPQDQLPPLYQSADIFVFPSIWDEPFGMPLVEAMSCGVPTIATRGGAFPEIVAHERTGLLVDRADPRSLADAILRLCSDDPLRQGMADAASARAREHFSWDRAADTLMREYRTAIAHRATRTAGV